MANAKLDSMLKKFGVVTVMDVEVYKYEKDSNGDWDSQNTLSAGVGKPITTLNSLKIVNINQDGPTKTATGGMNADPLLKYGKTFTVEMQDALGDYQALITFGGMVSKESDTILAATDRFSEPVTLVGSTFYIDQETGAKQPVKIIFPKFLPDTVFNIQHEAEGDASVFDLNGSLLAFKKYSTTGSADGATHKYGKGDDNEYYLIATENAYTTKIKGAKY